MTWYYGRKKIGTKEDVMRDLRIKGLYEDACCAMCSRYFAISRFIQYSLRGFVYKTNRDVEQKILEEMGAVETNSENDSLAEEQCYYIWIEGKGVQLKYVWKPDE